MTIQDDFRRLVAGELKAQNLSRSELARRMNVPPQYVTNYLNGRRTAGSDVIEKFFAALGYRPRIALEVWSPIQELT